MHNEASDRLRLSARRVIGDLRELAALTSTPQGAQRVAWGPIWRKAREWLRDKVAPLGLVDGNPMQIAYQAVGVLITVILACVGTWVILKICDATFGVRVDDEEEVQGLDLTQHGEEGYALEG